MKVVGFVGNDINVNQLEALGANVQYRGTFNGTITAVPYNAYIQFDSYDENRYRPYLQLDADLYGGRGDFGNGITEFVYREDDRLHRSIRFDFTDKELALLVEKGLYQPEFEIPSLFTDTTFDIPIEMDITEVELNGNRLVYASFDMVSDLQTDAKKSDYNLIEYFEEQHYEREDTYDFGIDTESEFVSEVEPEVVQEEETVEVETKSVVEPVRAYENPVDKFEHTHLDDFMSSETPDVSVSSELNDLLGGEQEALSEASDAAEDPHAPKIIHSGIRNAVEDYDASKAHTEQIMREQNEEAIEHKRGGLSFDDNPNF